MYVYLTKKQSFGHKSQSFLKQRRRHTHETQATSMIIIDLLNMI